MREFFSLQGVFKTRNLVVMALMASLSMVLEQYTTIYLTPAFKLITFSFLPWAVVATLYGPWAAVAFGFVADTVNYLAKPGGPYFMGYTLGIMLECFIYACFLYKKPIRIWRVAAARLLVTVLIELGLNYLWNTMLYGTAASTFFTGYRFAVRFAMLPLYTLMIVTVSRLSLEVQRRAALPRG